MLDEIEAELPQAQPSEHWRLHRRAELIRKLLSVTALAGGCVAETKSRLPA
jgi:hypothetical protein